MPDALSRLRSAGFPLATLTNSSSEMARAQLEHAGILELFGQVLSVEEVRRYKPAPEPYHMAAERLGVEPSDTRMVAAHEWDVWGAMQAGCAAAYVARTAVPFVLGRPPDITGHDPSERHRRDPGRRRATPLTPAGRAGEQRGFPSAPSSSILAVTAEQMREVDRVVVEDFDLLLIQMMENAGVRLAELAVRRFQPETVAGLCCRGGNDGGGLVAARHLANRGVRVAVTLGEDRSRLGEATVHQLAIFERMDVPIVPEPVASWCWTR